jgi:hypothetical protein
MYSTVDLLIELILCPRKLPPRQRPDHGACSWIVEKMSDVAYLAWWTHVGNIPAFLAFPLDPCFLFLWCSMFLIPILHVV